MLTQFFDDSDNDSDSDRILTRTLGDLDALPEKSFLNLAAREGVDRVRKSDYAYMGVLIRSRSGRITSIVCRHGACARRRRRGTHHDSDSFVPVSACFCACAARRPGYVGMPVSCVWVWHALLMPSDAARSCEPPPPGGPPPPPP